MTTTTRRALAVILTVFMVAAAASGGSMAAAPTIDTSASDSTSTTSELTDGLTVNDTDGTNDTAHTLQVNMTAGDDVEFNISRNGTDHVAAENTSMDNHTTNSGANGGHWNGTVTESELDDLERPANGNVTTTVTFWNASNESESNSIVVHWNFTDDRAVENLDDNDTDSEEGVETFDQENDLTTVTTFDIHTLQFSELDVDDMSINGDAGEAVVVLANGTVSDHASDAVPDGVEDAGPIFRMTLKVSADDGPDQLIRVYHEEAPDDVDEDDTYAVWKSDGIGGEDGIEINVGDEYEDADELSVTGTVNAGFIAANLHRIQTSEWNPLTMFSGLNLGLSDVLTGGVPAIVFAGAVVRRRRQGA